MENFEFDSNKELMLYPESRGEPFKEFKQENDTMFPDCEQDQSLDSASWLPGDGQLCSTSPFCRDVLPH